MLSITIRTANDLISFVAYYAARKMKQRYVAERERAGVSPERNRDALINSTFSCRAAQRDARGTRIY